MLDAPGVAAGECLRERRIRKQEAGKLFRGANQSFQIRLGGSVAQKYGFASVELHGKFSRAGDESDEAPFLWRKEAGDVDLRALAGGILNFQDAVAHRTARSGKCRGQQDGARSGSAERGQNFGGKKGRGLRSQSS